MKYAVYDANYVGAKVKIVEVDSVSAGVEWLTANTRNIMVKLDKKHDAADAIDRYGNLYTVERIN